MGAAATLLPRNSYCRLAQDVFAYLNAALLSSLATTQQIAGFNVFAVQRLFNDCGHLQNFASSLQVGCVSRGSCCALTMHVMCSTVCCIASACLARMLTFQHLVAEGAFHHDDRCLVWWRYCQSHWPFVTCCCMDGMPHGRMCCLQYNQCCVHC